MGTSEARLGQLAALLWEAAQCEEEVERCREALASRCDFAPYAAIQVLDYSHRGRVDAFDLVRYFQHCGVICTLAEAKAIISQFDSDQDGRLTEEELAFLLLPATNEVLRLEASTRTRSSALSCDTLRLLSQLLESELRYHKRVLKAGETLQDCSLRDILKALGQSEGLDCQTVKSLLLKYQYPATEATVDALLRRWSSQAGKLTLQELPTRQTSEDKEEIYIQGERQEVYHLPSPIDPLALSMVTPASDLLSFRTSPRNGTAEKASDVLAETWLEQLITLREAERMREELALRADFTLDAAYSLLLGTRKGPISSAELRNSLIHWGIEVVKEDSELLLTRYSLSPSLTLSSFSTLISPQSEAYFTLLSSRPISPKPVLSPATKELLFDLFRLLLHLEHRSEIRRQSFLSFDLDSLYSHLDFGQVGYLTTVTVNSYSGGRVPKELRSQGEYRGISAVSVEIWRRYRLPNLANSLSKGTESPLSVRIYRRIMDFWKEMRSWPVGCRLVW